MVGNRAIFYPKLTAGDTDVYRQTYLVIETYIVQEGLYIFFKIDKKVSNDLISKNQPPWPSTIDNVCLYTESRMAAT